MDLIIPETGLEMCDAFSESGSEVMMICPVSKVKMEWERGGGGGGIGIGVGVGVVGVSSSMEENLSCCTSVILEFLLTPFALSTILLFSFCILFFLMFRSSPRFPVTPFSPFMISPIPAPTLVFPSPSPTMTRNVIPAIDTSDSNLLKSSSESLDNKSPKEKNGKRSTSPNRRKLNSNSGEGLIGRDDRLYEGHKVNYLDSPLEVKRREAIKNMLATSAQRNNAVSK
eukprot:TRINITY_DN18270_c0_g1_i1.p1 TRINITY_DN18270_c0_g1~~TRINITY_DN18270_c0_g1_i1.p1  ORF type:complete len:227 (-),score=54.14 TRINITY_DN18270_c0_g1_i1:148-828(-)